MSLKSRQPAGEEFTAEGKPVGSLKIAMIGTRGLPAADGGVETGVAHLAHSLAAIGNHVTIYGRSAYADRQVIAGPGVEQVVLGHVRGKHLEAISHTGLATFHALARRRFDVIHYHATGPALLSWLPRIFGVPTVVTIHGLDWKREKWGPVARLVLKLGIRAATSAPNETIAVSKTLSSAGPGKRRAHYIPNGVHLDEHVAPIPIQELHGRPFLLFLGRIVPEKQVHLLLEAFRHLDADVDLAIVGGSSHSGDYVARVHALAQEDPRVKVLGSRRGGEKLWLLRNCLAFVQPSTVEGQPIALLEALASSCTTLVSDIPEHLEAVTVENTPRARIFRVGDGESLRTELASVVTDAGAPDERMVNDLDVGPAIRKRHDWARVARETRAIYHAAVVGRERTCSF